MATQMTLESSKMIGRRKKYQRKKRKKYQQSDTIGRVLNNVWSVYCIFRGKRGVIRAKLNFSGYAMLLAKIVILGLQFW